MEGTSDSLRSSDEPLVYKFPDEGAGGGEKADTKQKESHLCTKQFVASNGSISYLI